MHLRFVSRFLTLCKCKFGRVGCGDVGVQLVRGYRVLGLGSWLVGSELEIVLLVRVMAFYVLPNPHPHTLAFYPCPADKCLYVYPYAGEGNQSTRSPCDEFTVTIDMRLKIMYKRFVLD